MITPTVAAGKNTGASRFGTGVGAQRSPAGERAGRAGAAATGRLAAQRVARALPGADGDGADGTSDAHPDAHTDDR